MFDVFVSFVRYYAHPERWASYTACYWVAPRVFVALLVGVFGSHCPVPFVLTTSIAPLGLVVNLLLRLLLLILVCILEFLGPCTEGEPPVDLLC